MEDDVKGHPSDGKLEAYSLNKLDAPRVTLVEEHLLVCDFCRSRLEAIEPVNIVHYTEDGPVYLRATRLSTGAVVARRRGRYMEGGRTFRNVAGAKEYLNQSFAQVSRGTSAMVGAARHKSSAKSSPADGPPV
jgi:hypothetical protein